MDQPLEQWLRDRCLALPEAHEQETWGDPTFRVGSKIFAMVKRGDGRVSVWCKAAPGVQEALVAADPARFFRPPYLGHRGWIALRADGDADRDELADLITDSYRLVAPKRLSARIGSFDR